MDKKSLMGLALAAVVTLSSTSVIAFASQNTEKSTRNVIKVETSNVKNISTNYKTKLINISDEEAIQIAKKAIKDNYGVDVDEAGFTAKPYVIELLNYIMLKLR